ncbi:MAG: mandelate racemase [Spirochaetaceae bacterium]|nr:MAG: mandelate racemase [Spirochaetaceae bacterium]
MKLVKIEERRASIASEIRNAYIDFSAMDVSVVKITTDVVIDGEPVVGYGFNSNGRYAQSGILRDRIIPRIEGAPAESLLDDTRENIDPSRVWTAMMKNEKPGGHGERSVAVGVIDMALWDIVAKVERRPLCAVLAQRYGRGAPDPRVFVYAAGGYYYPGKGIDELRREIAGYLERGYSTVKIKIGGRPIAEDIERIEAVGDLLDGDFGRLAVDANGRFDLATAVQYAEAIEPYGLFWYEEAGDPLDYELQSDLAGHYRPALATGENLFSMQDARNLLRYAGMRPDRDYLQMDPALSYGLVEYLRTLDVLAEHGWSPRRCIPHGGHQFALHIAAGIGLGGNESYPGIFAPFGGFADDTPVEDGYVALPDVPGIGFETKGALMDLFRRLF